MPLEDRFPLPFRQSALAVLDNLQHHTNWPRALPTLSEQIGNNTNDFYFYTCEGIGLLAVADGTVAEIYLAPEDRRAPDHKANVVLNVGGVAVHYAHILPTVKAGERVQRGQVVGVQDPDYHPNMREALKHMHLTFYRTEGGVLVPHPITITDQAAGW